MTFTPEIKLEKADHRGEIYSITLPDNQEFMLIHSRKDVYRGGHSHNVPETVMLLSGKMRYIKQNDPPFGETVVVLEAGDASSNEADQPHLGYFLEDTWLIERKLGVEAHSAVDTDYERYRQLVRES